MRRYIDASIFLTEAKMMWKDCHKAYILVEGATDKTFFTTLFNAQDNIRFRAVSGWEQVYSTVLLAQEDAFAHLSGVIDSDYHDILEDEVCENSQLFFTDYHDIEMMLFFSESYIKFLSVCASEDKIKKYADIRQPILDAASYLGALRAISLLNQYNFHFDGFECRSYIDKSSLNADYKKLIEKIIQRTRSKGATVTVTNLDLEEQVDLFIQKYGNQSLCNGHDVLDILSIAMQKIFASASSNQYSADSIFNHLLMGYSYEEFKTSALCQKLVNWMHYYSNVA